MRNRHCRDSRRGLRMEDVESVSLRAAKSVVTAAVQTTGPSP